VGSTSNLKRSMVSDQRRIVCSFPVPELQGTTQEVASAKCRSAVEQLGTSCVTEDTALCFEALKGLPGPYIKQFMESLGHDGGSVETLQSYKLIYRLEHFTTRLPHHFRYRVMYFRLFTRSRTRTNSIRGTYRRKYRTGKRTWSFRLGSNLCAGRGRGKDVCGDGRCGKEQDKPSI